MTAILPDPLHLFVNVGLGALATLGFAVWFSVPREALGRVVAVGASGFLARRLLLDAGLSLPLATLWAASLIGVAGLLGARRFNIPRVTFTVTGIIPLVPGAAAYRSLERFSSGDVAAGSESFVQAILVTFAIVGGLTMARAITFFLPKGLRV